MTIRFNEPFVTGKEIQYLSEVLAHGEFGGNGPFTKRVHELLQARYGVPHVLLTHSCTGALELAALSLDIGPGDEVIVPSYTFATTASSFLRTGASIVFCEIDPSTMNLDPEDALDRMTERTRVIVPVHYGGIGSDIPLILKEAGPQVEVVEDAAQGIEARFEDQFLGTMAPLGTISFHETKNLHSGLGGALFVNDPRRFDRIEDMWERGTNRTKMFRGNVDKYTWVELGSSFYPSELQAAFLLAQLEAIDRNMSERRRLYDVYSALLVPLRDRGLLELPVVAESHQLNYHSVFLILRSRETADTVRAHLLRDDIHAYIGYVPLHSSPMGLRMGYKPSDLPLTEEFAPRVLRLPMHNKMSVDDVEVVCRSLESALDRHDFG